MSETAPLSNPSYMDDGQSSGPDLHLVRDVGVVASVEIGRRQITLADAMNIAPGAIIQLNREIDSLLDLRINGQLVAKGEVIVVDNDFGIRIVEIIEDGQS